MMPRYVIAWVVTTAILLSGCANSRFDVPAGGIDEAAYTSVYPWYAEFCALSEIDKKPGLGATIVPGGPGGHSILYLNGVCVDKAANYPVVALCGNGRPKPGEGVGLSVNDHYRNANWIATPGRDFVFRGDLPRGEPLTRITYLRTQAKAERMGILNGVVFHGAVFNDQPANMSKVDFMYDMSVATDYAVGFGRDRYCARVPLDRARMAVAVAFLNAVNAPYRSGEKVFEWNVLRNNCAHLAHNVLAAAGVWAEWPIERPLLVAAFDFPVPKNEFVNLMRRTNDLPIADPDALYDDAAARATIMTRGWLPTEPGGLAEAEPAIRPNEVYNTDLRTIFYDEPILGRYQKRFDRVFSEPRYTDLRANLEHFSRLYTTILARPPAEATGSRAAFDARYHAAIDAAKTKLDAARRVLSADAG